MLKWGTLSKKETEQVNERERQTLEEAKVDKKHSAPLVPTLAVILKSTFLTSLVIINRTLVHHPHCYINTGVAGWLAYYLLITLVFTFFYPLKLWQSME